MNQKLWNGGEKDIYDKDYNIADIGKSTFIKNLLGRKGLLFIETLIKVQKKAYKSIAR